MGNLTLNGQTVLTQVGTNKPEFGAGVPSGTILQVQHTQFDSTAVMTGINNGSNYVLCDGAAGSGTEILNVNITPKFNNSKIWIQVQWTGEFNPVSMTWNSIFFLYRNTIKLHNTTGAGESGIMTPSTSYTSTNEDSTPENCMFQYFDVPATTDTITYKVGFLQTETATGGVLYTNRTVSNNTSGGYERGVSSIVAMEIAA